MTNGSSDVLEAPVKDDENDGNVIAKSKQKPPWVSTDFTVFLFINCRRFYS